MTPVYLLNLYSKWQRLDIVETLKKFFLFRSTSSSGGGSSTTNTTRYNTTYNQTGSFGGFAGYIDIERSQMFILLAIATYWMTVVGMVKFLRRDYTRNQ